MKLYKITADYRRNNTHKPSYYVLGESAKDARRKFKERITWLDIYGCEVVDEAEARHIVAAPLNYIVF